jgi:hypothetical protein
MTQMVLDDGNFLAGVQKVRGHGVPQSMRRVAAGNARQIPIPDEERLDLAFPQWTGAPYEERALRGECVGAGFPEELLEPGEQRSLGPEAALPALDHDAVSNKVHIGPVVERYFPDSEGVQIDECEKRPVSWAINRGQESPDFVLGEVPGKALYADRRIWLVEGKWGGHSAD